MATDETAAVSLAGANDQARVPLLAWALAIGVLWIALDLLGWEVGAWFGRLWEAMTGVSPGYLVLGLALQTAQARR
jgi:putative Mn2+ efflux pump MntP